VWLGELKWGVQAKLVSQRRFALMLAATSAILVYLASYFLR
jgi:hypothetical protein